MKCFAKRDRHRQPAFRVVVVPLLVLFATSAHAGVTEIIEEAERLVSSNRRRAHQADRRQPQVPKEIGRAIGLFREAREQSEKAGDDRLAARATLGLGAALLTAGQNEEGIVELDRAVQLARQLNDGKLETSGLMALSPVFRERGAFSESSIVDRRLVDLGRSRADPSAEISGWNGLCSASRRRGRFHEAIEAARHGVAVADASTAAARSVSPHLEFAIRYCLGKSLMNVADYASGMHHLQAALGTATTAALRGGSWHALHDIGEWYATHGDLHTATRYYERALEGAAALSPDAEATTLGAIALVDEAKGHLHLALERQTEAVRLATSVGYERLLAENEMAMSRILFKLGRTEKAAGKLELAFEKAQTLDQVIPTIGILLERGNQNGALGRIAEAQAAYLEALAVARAQGLRGFEPAALTGLARLARQQGDLDRARELYMESERAIDQIRSSITSVEQRRVFAPAMRETYVGLVDVFLLLAGDQPDRVWLEQALLTSERERSQSLRHELQDAALTHATGEADHERQDVERQVAELQLRLATERIVPPAREDLLRRLDDAERELDLLERLLPGQWSVPNWVEPLVSILRPSEAFVSYLIEEGSWRAIVVAGGSLHAVALPPLEELDTQIDFFNSLLREGRGEEALVAGRALAATFVAPILPVLPEMVSSLVVSVTGGAAAVSLGVLPDPKRDGRPLLERLAVTYTPSLSFLSHLRRRGMGTAPDDVMKIRTRSPTLLALAFSDPTGQSPRIIWRDRPVARLSWAADEARSIARSTRARADILLDREASERNLKDRPLNHYRVIHLAAHALLDPDLPARSAILLGQGDGEDGFLQPREIYSLPLGGLVVLSGCETAFGRSSGADGMHSLARAFLHAGAQTVVGSLWKIEDQAARDFMVTFYQELATGKDVGEALVAARLPSSGSEPYANAAAWAGIVLVGDPSFRPFPKRTMLGGMLDLSGSGVVAIGGVMVIVATMLVAWRRRRGRRVNAN